MHRYTNHYRCSGSKQRGRHPKTEWTDESSSTNSDHCPNCHAEIEPYLSDDLAIPEADGADIVVCINNGDVTSVKCPPGLSVQVRDYDVQDIFDEGELVRDEDGEECTYRWEIEPGEANADERPARERPARPHVNADGVKLISEMVEALRALYVKSGRGRSALYCASERKQAAKVLAQFACLQFGIEPNPPQVKQ